MNARIAVTLTMASQYSISPNRRTRSVLMRISAADAATYVFDAEGQSQTVFFNGFNDGVLDSDLQAKLTLTLFEIDANGDFTFKYSFENLSTGNDATPLWIPQLAMASGTIVLAIAFIDELMREWRGVRRMRAPEEALHHE